MNPMYRHPQLLLQLCWPLIFRMDSFVINASPIRFSSETDVTTVNVLNSYFWDYTSASVLLVVNSKDKEPKQTGERGLFFQTFLYLDVFFTSEFLALKSVYNTSMNILSSNWHTDNKIMRLSPLRKAWAIKKF